MHEDTDSEAIHSKSNSRVEFKIPVEFKVSIYRSDKFVSKTPLKPGMAIHAYNTSIQGAQAGRLPQI